MVSPLEMHVDTDYSTLILVYGRKMSVLAKIVILGDGGVGKTTLRHNYLGQGFQARYIMTIGADFSVKEETIEGRTWRFQIWDLKGQERFAAVRGLYYAGCVGAILVYDVTRPESLINLRSWIAELLQHTHQNLALIILANKVDIRQEGEQHITTEQGLDYIERLWEDLEKKSNIGFLEVSATNGFNLGRIFRLLGKMILFNTSADRIRSIPPSLFRMPWVDYLDFGSLIFQDNIFCPFCGAPTLLTGREEQTGLQRGFCARCGNSTW